MTDHYPGKTLLEEARYLREKLIEKLGEYSNIGVALFPTLLPKWTSRIYRQYDAVLYNGNVYRCAAYGGDTSANPPKNDGNPWYKATVSNWPTYVQGTTYNKGDRVFYPSSTATTPVDITSTDGTITETVSGARVFHFVSKVDNNTSLPTSSSKWTRMYASHPIYLTPRPR